MVRTLDPLAHSVRRETFLDAAQRLMQAKGYERMSIQEVIEDVGASKGAFYHYFGSKSALLEAVVDRMVEDATGSVAPRVTDASVPALSRLDALFTGIATWKGERTELLLAVMEVWFADDNAIAREKFRQGVVRRLTPLLAGIIERGKREGTFTATSPDHAARVVVSLLMSLNEAATDLFYARRAGRITFEDVQVSFAAYAEAIERILGLTPGTFPVADQATLRRWFG